jgi:hypothetical protein
MSTKTFASLATGVRTLVDVESALMEAVTMLPAAAIRSNNEVGTATGLNVALYIVRQAIVNAADAASLAVDDGAKPSIESLTEQHTNFQETVRKAIYQYANGRILLLELCDQLGVPYPEDKKVMSLAKRVRELEDQLEQSKARWTLADRLATAEAEVTRLQERVAYAEKARDEAAAPAVAALTKAKEKSDRLGRHVGKLVKAVRHHYAGVLTKPQLADIVLAVMADDLGVKRPEEKKQRLS